MRPKNFGVFDLHIFDQKRVLRVPLWTGHATLRWSVNTVPFKHINNKIILRKFLLLFRGNGELVATIEGPSTNHYQVEKYQIFCVNLAQLSICLNPTWPGLVLSREVAKNDKGAVQKNYESTYYMFLFHECFVLSC